MNSNDQSQIKLITDRSTIYNFAGDKMKQEKKKQRRAREE